MIHLKQHELPKGCTVEFPDGSKGIFQKMDGMYAVWDIDGETKVKNYKSFAREGKIYKVIRHD